MNTMYTPKLKHLALIIFSFIFIPGICISQSNNWQKAYRPDGDLYCEGICPTTDGNYFLLMRQYRVLIYRINAQGDSLSAIRYPSRHSQTCISPGDGGILFTGSASTRPYSTRLTSQGNVYWDIDYMNGYGTPFLSYILKTSDSYITVGETILKINLNGEFVWQKNIPTGYSRYYWNVIEGLSGGYVHASEVCEGVGQPTVGAAALMDTSGVLIWDKRFFFEGSNNGLLHPVIDKNSSSYFLGGYCCYPASSGNYNVVILKLNQNGGILDTLNIVQSDTYHKFFLDMKFISSNRIVMLYSRTRYQDSTIATAMIIDTSGNIIRSSEYSGTDYTKLTKIFIQNSNTIFFTGISDHFSFWFENPFVVKTDTTLYAPPVSVRNISQTVPDNFYLDQNYPNPFNSHTRITFGIFKKATYRFRIFDITGKLVKELFNQQLIPGEYCTDFHGENISSGVYFYRLETENAILAKKFVILK